MWLAKVTTLWLPLKDRLEHIDMSPVCVHAPTRLLHSIWMKYTAVFHQVCGSSDGALRDFWTKVDSMGSEVAAAGVRAGAP